jgi:hypothetical protein
LTRAALADERRLVRWAARGDLGSRRVRVGVGETREVAELEDYGGFGEGWSFPTDSGMWTLGRHTELALRLDGLDEEPCVLAFGLASACAGPEAPLEVDLLLNGERVSSRVFGRGESTLTWQVELPADVRADGSVDVSFAIAEPRSPLTVGWSTEDDRPFGLLVRSVTLKVLDRSLRIGEVVTFTTGSGGDRFLGEGWGELEPTGVWTIAEAASLVFALGSSAREDVELVLEGTAFVARDHPELAVEVAALDRPLAEAVLRVGKPRGRLHVPLREAARAGEAVIDLRLHHPARPVDLGLSGDFRLLGFHLHSLVARRRSWRGDMLFAVRYVTPKLRRRLLGPLRSDEVSN